MEYIKSKTKAIKLASAYVGLPVKTGEHSWQITGPFDSSKPDGATTTSQRSTYLGALEKRSAWTADIALYMMGAPNEARYHADYASSCMDVKGARALINYGLSRCPNNLEND